MEGSKRRSGPTAKLPFFKTKKFFSKVVDNRTQRCYTYIIKEREGTEMRTIELKKINKWWYVIVKDENGKNVVLADFTTKKAATDCRDLWIAEKRYGDLVKKN